MHKLLRRQLKRAFGSDTELPAGLEGLLAMVDEAYCQADSERLLQERALELTSHELLEGNRVLREERQEFFQLIERMPHMVAIRRGSHFAYINPVGVSLLGFKSAEEVLRRPILELIHPDDRAQEQRRAARADVPGTTEHAAEVRYLRGDGEIVTLEVQTIKQVDYEGRSGELLIATDLSERKKMQERLIVADRMASVGTLAAGVAHEINNPLSYVISNLAYLQSEPAGPISPEEEAERTAALHEARHGAERVRSIVRDLKTLSRPDEVQRAPVDVRRVLETSASMAANQIRLRARLVREFAEVDPVLCNESKLGQVFLNLLVNAAQALPEGRADHHRITAYTGMCEGKVVVEIRDTGPGIPKHVLPRIFDPFFTTKPVGVGTGLGLSICHGIVVGLGGRITVATSPGGTTFRVELPSISAQDQPRGEAGPARLASGS